MSNPDKSKGEWGHPLDHLRNAMIEIRDRERAANGDRERAANDAQLAKDKAENAHTVILPENFQVCIWKEKCDNCHVGRSYIVCEEHGASVFFDNCTTSRCVVGCKVTVRTWRSDIISPPDLKDEDLLKRLFQHFGLMHLHCDNDFRKQFFNKGNYVFTPTLTAFVKCSELQHDSSKVQLSEIHTEIVKRKIVLDETKLCWLNDTHKLIEMMCEAKDPKLPENMEKWRTA